MIGGATYEESKEVAKLSKEYGIEIILIDSLINILTVLQVAF